MTRDAEARMGYEQSTYVAGQGRRYGGMAVYRLVLVCIVALSVLAGLVLLVVGFGPGHPVMLAPYILAGLAVCLFGGSFLDTRRSQLPSDPSYGTDFPGLSD